MAGEVTLDTLQFCSVFYNQFQLLQMAVIFFAVKMFT